MCVRDVCLCYMMCLCVCAVKQICVKVCYSVPGKVSICYNTANGVTDIKICGKKQFVFLRENIRLFECFVIFRLNEAYGYRRIASHGFTHHPTYTDPTDIREVFILLS